MKKTEKKIENHIIAALTQVCEICKLEVDGFMWNTHFVNYNYFPGSLRVICVFDTNAQLAKARQSNQDSYIIELTKNEFEKMGIKIKDFHQVIDFDTEENCKNKHGGKWNKRFI